MSDLRYILIKEEGQRLVADPKPVGWDNPNIVLDRDIDWHGLFFDYGLDLLTFMGEAADWIKEEYRQRGVDGKMMLLVEFMCSENSEYDELYKGKIAFDSRYKETCGIECSVTVALEDSNDVMLFRNNYEQKVDLNKNIAFDGVTELVDYEGINFNLNIPGRGLLNRTSGQSIDQEITPYPITMTWAGLGGVNYIRPSFSENMISEIADSDLIGQNIYSVSPQGSTPIHPQVLSPVISLVSIPRCSNNVFKYRIRLKGNFRETADASRTVSLQVVVTNSVSYNDTLDPALGKVNLLSVVNYTAANGPNIEFDEMFQGEAVIPNGGVFYVFVFYVVTFNSSLRTSNVFMDWHKETAINLESITSCDPTTARSYMINEAISRVSEAITNDQIRFYSSIFGRKDSQPYSLSNNPCQGMFAITSGLNIRRRLLPDGTQPGFFVSMADLFDGLNPMWNIGLCIEPDPNRPGYKRLRFEDYEYFYRNEVGLWFNFANRIEKSIDTSRIFNRVIVGYNKWEAEQYTGLDEFMTRRTYRLNINTLSAEKQLTTDIICSPYTIEITRRLDATTEDWKYDNDVFGFCLRESDEVIPVGPDVQVEVFTDGITGVENILDSDTCYNGRVSPLRMAMRWFNNLLQGLRQITSSTKLIFTSGEGNYVAKYRLNNCDIAGAPIRENDDVDITDFSNPIDAQPVVFPELDTFEHPMNYNVFKRLKDDPTLMFKTVVYLCNNEVREGWIKRISYQLTGGIAEITVIPKNNLQLPIPEPPCSAKILTGSITSNETAPGEFTFDFTEEESGGDNWSYVITKPADPNFSLSGNVTSHPFVVSGITPGDYQIQIIPYCGTRIGQNVATYSFNKSEPFNISLSTILTTGLNPFNKLRLTASGNVVAPNNISFKFGQCCVNTSSGIETCAGFVGAPFPSFGTMTINTGQMSNTVDSGESTPGADFGYITKIIIYDLVGITPAQITKAAGQTWTLVFQ